MSATIRLPEPITGYLEALHAAGEVEALRRVAEAGAGEWMLLHFLGEDGRRCLVGHAEGWMADQWPNQIDCPGDLRGKSMDAFDDFAAEVGPALAGRLCAEFAGRLLAGAK